MPLDNWLDRYVGVETMKGAVMSSVVNCPGESKQANIGISLPDVGEAPSAPVFVDGVKVKTLKGENIAEEYKQMIEDYVVKTYSPREQVISSE